MVVIAVLIELNAKQDRLHRWRRNNCSSMWIWEEHKMTSHKTGHWATTITTTTISNKINHTETTIHAKLAHTHTRRRSHSARTHHTKCCRIIEEGNASRGAIYANCASKINVDKYFAVLILKINKYERANSLLSKIIKAFQCIRYMNLTWIGQTLIEGPKRLLVSSFRSS